MTHNNIRQPAPDSVGFGRRAFWSIIAVIIVIAVVVVGYVAYNRVTHHTYTAHFTEINGLYTGDPVKVLGVNVGAIERITPHDADVEVAFRVDADVDIPANASAISVAQSLVSGRFIQLTPVYERGGKLADHADIPMNRTAVPVEWDDIKKELSKLSGALGPTGDNDGPAASLVKTADKNLRGNGAAIRDSIKQLSTVAGRFGDSRGDIFAVIRNLQKLTDALANSHEQIVQFNGRIASVSQVLADNTSNLDGALTNLDSALGDLRSFLDTNKTALTESVGRLSAVTSTVKQKDEQIRALLHSAPTQLSNFYNIYNPLTGGVDGQFGLGQAGDLISLLCGTIATDDRPGLNNPADVAKCVDVIGPVVQSVAVNYPPALVNPVTAKTANPGQIQYQDDQVRADARRDIRERDQHTRKSYGSNQALANLLVPAGAES